MTHLTLHQGGVDQDTRRLPAVTAVLEQFSGAVPEDAILQQNYPNPFNSSTSIPFALSEATDVNLGVYDLKRMTSSRIAEVRIMLPPFFYRMCESADRGAPGPFFMRSNSFCRSFSLSNHSDGKSSCGSHWNTSIRLR